MNVANKARLTNEQIVAAGTLRSTLKRWQLTDNALALVRTALRGFGPEESLLKVVAINALYGTNVLALDRAALHVQAVLASVDLVNAGPELVESLAAIPTTPGRPARRYISFASKFAHFFINPERFPIYDSYAQGMLLFHLGPRAVHNPRGPYKTFTQQLDTLMRDFRLTCSYGELDHYLWLAGLYRSYLQGESRLNTETLVPLRQTSPRTARASSGHPRRLVTAQTG